MLAITGHTFHNLIGTCYLDESFGGACEAPQTFRRPHRPAYRRWYPAPTRSVSQQQDPIPLGTSSLLCSVLQFVSAPCALIDRAYWVAAALVRSRQPVGPAFQTTVQEGAAREVISYYDVWLATGVAVNLHCAYRAGRGARACTVSVLRAVGASALFAYISDADCRSGDTALMADPTLQARPNTPMLSGIYQ